MKMKIYFVTLIAIISSNLLCAQEFTKADELRGAITEQRAWWDLQHYDLSVEVFPEAKKIEGVNVVSYKVLDQEKVMQIDLQAPMKINKVTQNGKKLKFKVKEGSHYFIKLSKKQQVGDLNEIVIHWSGKPVIAKNAPWDGGFSWKKDENNNHFIATSNQGIGASIWWPNKDHAYDEPDNGIDLKITAPSELVAVGNGRLKETIDNGKTKTWHWTVTNPINNYGVNINIGDYVNFSEQFEGLDGLLDMDYWVLRDNLDKAKEQFKQAPMMMRAFEYWFGPYPFYEDSFKLVEVPYLGMEHQSSVTYGNKYENGYLGSDLSGTGWGLRFDFIIIHEAGHEWFANNITHVDVADMWIHEGFTAYSESLYLEYQFSPLAGSEYVIGTRKGIQNDKPIIGNYNVHDEGSSDMYYKGANLLHTIRQLIEDDNKWRDILRGLNKDFYHQTVTSEQVENYISEKSGIDLSTTFDQYLRTTMIPKLEIKVENYQFMYRYVNIVEGFDMPIIAVINDKEQWVQPNNTWQTFENTGDIRSLYIKDDFYIEKVKVN